MTDQNLHPKYHFDQSTPATVTFFKNPKDRHPPPIHHFAHSTPATVTVFVNPNGEMGLRLVAPEIGKEFQTVNVIQSALSTVILSVDGTLYFNDVRDLTGIETYKISTEIIGDHKAYTRIEFFRGGVCVAEFVSDPYDPSDGATLLEDGGGEGVWTDIDSTKPGEQHFRRALAPFRLEAPIIDKRFHSDNINKSPSSTVALIVEGTLYYDKVEDLTGIEEYEISTVPIEPPKPVDPPKVYIPFKPHKAYITIKFFKEKKCVAEFVSEPYDLFSHLTMYGGKGSGSWNKNMTDQIPHPKYAFAEATPATVTFFKNPKDRHPPPKHHFAHSTPATVTVFVNPNRETGLRLVALEIGKEFQTVNVIQSALSTVILSVDGTLYFDDVRDLTGIETYKISTELIGDHKAYTRIEFFKGGDCVAEFVSDPYDLSDDATLLEDKGEGVWTDINSTKPGKQHIQRALVSFLLKARKIHKEFESDNVSKSQISTIALTMEGTLYYDKVEDLTGIEEYEISTVPIEPPKPVDPPKAYIPVEPHKAYITIEFFKEKKCVAERTWILGHNMP